VLATDTPENLRQGARGSRRLRTPSSANLEEATGSRTPEAANVVPSGKTNVPARLPRQQRHVFSLQRLVAYTIRETIELLRDPIRLGFALFGTALLMLGVRIWLYRRTSIT